MIAPFMSCGRSKFCNPGPFWEDKLSNLVVYFLYLITVSFLVLSVLRVGVILLPLFLPIFGVSFWKKKQGVGVVFQDKVRCSVHGLLTTSRTLM